jgi:ABC-type multidrug transport system fused ATPase/permease subunit
MNSQMADLFGPIIAVILLILFSVSTIYMIWAVVDHCSALQSCETAVALFGDGFKYVVTTVGGLVSALVIAHLTVAEPGRTPKIGSFVPVSRAAVATTNIVVLLYLLAWIATGLAALVVGVMIYPKASTTLADLGTTWLGLAVAAAYAYFGIKPPVDTRAAGRFDRRSGDDLSQGERVPDASEADTSGPIVKKIKKTDPEFAKLVSNTNAKIVFKDEEGTGADRMMTSRLQGQLDALADLVAAEWAGTKLRVTEAWDEDNEHSGNSLHYEARAADITTHPIDGTKLGRLARLAVNAGCDWVFFEDSSHVHVSAKK